MGEEVRIDTWRYERIRTVDGDRAATNRSSKNRGDREVLVSRISTCEVAALRYLSEAHEVRSSVELTMNKNS
jgi:hypothetical protein